MQRRTPLKRKRAKPRRTTSPRCSVLRCKLPAKVEGYCITHGMKEADRLFSLHIRARDVTCQAPNAFGLECKGRLQAAHIYSRRYYATRYDPYNVHALCEAHHLKVDTHQAEKDDWAVAMIGAPRLRMLREIAIEGADKAQAIADALAWLA